MYIQNAKKISPAEHFAFKVYHQILLYLFHAGELARELVSLGQIIFAQTFIDKFISASLLGAYNLIDKRLREEGLITRSTGELG